MPELAEVETICKNISQFIIGKQFLDIQVFRSGLRIEFPKDMREILKDAYVQSVERRAKYLIVNLVNLSQKLIIHLGMSGRLSYCPVGVNIYQKHDHITFKFDDSSELVYNDYRRFGLVTIIDGNIHEHKLFRHLGIEPLSEDFTVEYLYHFTQKTISPIKNILMNNQIVVGIGNIYAAESLFLAQISPVRASNTLSIFEIEKLVAACKYILTQAIEAGGSTIKDYQSINGASGKFQDMHKVYGRLGLACHICDKFIISVKQAGRSSFYCETCQK